jgi:hypothetical protein
LGRSGTPSSALSGFGEGAFVSLFELVVRRGAGEDRALKAGDRLGDALRSRFAAEDFLELRLVARDRVQSGDCFGQRQIHLNRILNRTEGLSF